MEKEQVDIEALWDEYFSTGGEEVKNKIISHYLYIVSIVVKRLMPQYKDYSEKDELMSCGVIGLIDAVNKFDRSFGVKFQTYATVRIRGEIIDYMRKQDWAPSSLRKKISNIQDAIEVLEAELNRRPTEAEIADYLGVKESMVQKVLQKSHMFNLVYFESMIYEKESEENVEMSRNDPYLKIENEVMLEALKKLIDQLPERERLVITLHYFEGMTMKNIAKIMNISESRVSQIHSRILMDMRKALQD
ncbi:MAG TPA: FliA/WhiG family RNA polymerase sigma factor [Papillibacter sp.]|jgi:RNA polymerase sigma factor for flagellar operon FliA|nr:FliA/WhiG family RNA polymerase sigma factor [Papillibacter sp.]